MTLITQIDFSADPGPSRFQMVRASWIRPNNATPYTDYDIVGDSTTACIGFQRAGRSGMIHDASIVVGATFASTGFELLIFDEQPTNHADNAPLALVAGDIPKIIAHFQFLDGDKLGGSAGTAGVSIYQTSVGVSTTRYAGPKPFYSADTYLYGLLVVRGTPTITAQTKFSVKLGIERDE